MPTHKEVMQLSKSKQRRRVHSGFFALRCAGMSLKGVVLGLTQWVFEDTMPANMHSRCT